MADSCGLIDDNLAGTCLLEGSEQCRRCQWRPMTPAEAEAALNAIDHADCPPLTKEQIDRTVDYATGKTNRLPSSPSS